MGNKEEPFNIFLSWSGPTSYKIAAALKNLLEDLFNKKVSCWISIEDISAGAEWNPELINAIQKANFGIVCYTPENLKSQWLQYEGGALVASIRAKKEASFQGKKEASFQGKKEASFVSVYLSYVKKDDIPKTFSSLQGICKDYEGTKKLLWDINGLLNEPINVNFIQFDRIFRDSWKDFDSNFPDCPDKSIRIRLQEITDKILSDLKYPVNSYAESLLESEFKKLHENFSVKNGIATFKAPASTYPYHLMSLLDNFGHPVKAIAIVDDIEHFWQGTIGGDIIGKTPRESQRVFVFENREHLKKSIDFIRRHAQKYRVYAMSELKLNRFFYRHAYDFSIIGTEILAKYDPPGEIEFISFTTDPNLICEHETAFNDIVHESIEMTADQATEDNTKRLIEEVFGEVGTAPPYPYESIEMSAYVSVPKYAQFEEDHAYFIDMMNKMLLHFNKNRDTRTQCRVLELGAGTGHFTKRLISSGNVSVTAVEFDWACYHYLRGALETNPILPDTPNYKLRVVNADSRDFADPDGKLFDFIFSSFADHHIKPADKKKYFENIKRNLSPDGLLIVGDEFIPSYDPKTKDSFRHAVEKYHNHIIDIAKAERHHELIELETAAMKSGLNMRGDFKMPCEEYEKYLNEAKLRFTKEKIGPEKLEDVGGIYVYVIRKDE